MSSFHKLGFLLPGFLVLLAIILFPLLFTIRVSLSGWDAITPGLGWAGIKNYVGVFNDTRFWQSMFRLAGMAVGTVIIQYVLGFALALLSGARSGSGVFSAFYFLFR